MENVKKLEPSFQGTLVDESRFLALACQAREEESTLEGLHVENIRVTGADFSTLALRKVSFRHCRFVDCDWSGAELEDVVAECCDWSASRLTGVRWHGCRWTDCKGVGCDCSDGILHRSSFTDCNFLSNNFKGSTFKQVSFIQTDLTGAQLSQCRWKDLTFSHCKLTEASFFRTAMGGLDVTTCQIDGLILSQSGEELRGLIVDPLQAAALARRLGLVIRT